MKILVFLLVACSSMLFAQSVSADDTNPKALPPEGEVTKASQINIKLQVPQMTTPETKLTAYPYTTKPMRVSIVPNPLPTSAEGIRGLILASGYSNRNSLEKPYPDGGWRWQYAFRNGLKRSGQSTPKVMIGIYKWTDGMVKYILPECLRINEIEAKRMQRYYQLVQDYEDNHKDEEMEALRRNQEPHEMKLRPVKRDSKLVGYNTSLELTPGEWWITGQHKVPGLVYYWQYPLVVKAGENYNLTLDDSNASLIQGGW